ncbi:MAG: ABC transporter substrate-binding protein [Schwartzia sp. (in: firmicutes)]
MGMKKRLAGMVALLFLLAAFAGCGGAGTPAAEKNAGYTVTDARNRQVRISHKPEHIVTLGLYTDEMVLGMVPTDKMAAVSHYLDDPKESVLVEKAKKIHNKVTDPTVEQILSWKPDLVIANGWTSEDKIKTLTDMGIPVVVCGSTNSYAEIQETLRLVAESIGEVEKGEKIRQKMDAIRDEIMAKVAKIPAEERKSVVLLSLMTSYGGAGSAFDDMCRHAGVVNASAAAGLQNGQNLTKEMLIKSDPDFLLLPVFDDQGNFDPQKFIDGYLKDPSLQTMKAIRNQAFVYPRESYIYNASQDFVFGIQEIAYCAYGDDFRQDDKRHISFSGEE